MVYEKKIECLTPSLRGFYENVGKIEGVTLKKTTFVKKENEIVLFTGSILDKSEIAYRNITQTKGIYYTVLPMNVKLDEVEAYWFKHTTVCYKKNVLTLIAALKLD